MAGILTVDGAGLGLGRAAASGMIWPVESAAVALAGVGFAADGAATVRTGSAFVAANSKASTNSLPLWYRSRGVLERARRITAEIAGGTRGCAIFNGCGTLSRMAR